MKIGINTAVSFGRRLKTSEEAEFSDVLKQGKAKVGNTGKSVLIVPSSSLPQSSLNNTGVGNLAGSDEQKFFDFAKKYWGINEIQILPSGQYHSHSGIFPIYSGTSMDLGNHLIDVKSYLSESEFQEIVKKNKVADRVNFANVVDKNSAQEKALRKLFDNVTPKMKKDFEAYKALNSSRLETKGLYRALREIHGTHRFKEWNDLDKNLFNEDVVKLAEREKRIEEIYKLKGKEIDFYKFKQFLADNSLKNAKEKLNSNGLKLNGDMLCGFSYDEVWANPKAFLKDATIGWDLPAPDFDNPEFEKLFREKVRFYMERFDGLRVDASWVYVSPNIKTASGMEKKYFGDKFLNIIDEEAKKAKGAGYDLKNIMHEFAAGPDEFSVYEGSRLRDCVKNRTKIYTSDWLSVDWGSNKNFINRGWDKECFIIGARNHDSLEIKKSEKQIEALSEIFNIPKEKLMNDKEFVKAKLAEPAAAYNNMLYFMDGLGINGNFSQNSDKTLNYTSKISSNYEKEYFEALQRGEAFNPMDALEKNFKAKGLDKTEPKLYKKIVKYKKILQKKEGQTSPWIKIGIGAVCSGLVLFGLFKYYSNNRNCLSSKT